MDIAIVLMNAIHIHYLCQKFKRVLKYVTPFTVNITYRRSCCCCVRFFNFCSYRQILLSFRIVWLKFSMKKQLKGQKYYRALWSVTDCTQAEAQVMLRFRYDWCYFVKRGVKEEENIVWLYCVDITMDKFRQNTKFRLEISPKI